MIKKINSSDQNYVTQAFLSKELATFRKSLMSEIQVSQNMLADDIRAMHNELVTIINDNFAVFRDEIHENKVGLLNHESRIRAIENNPKKFRLAKLA